MKSENIEIPDDFEGSVRLFPLPDHVLFPGNIEPLHLFEPQYCELIEAAQQSDSLITMATLTNSAADERGIGSPPIARDVCIGKVIAHKRNENGTHGIVLAGLARARIQREYPLSHLYREAEVEILPEWEPNKSQSTNRLFHFLVQEFTGLLKSRTGEEPDLPKLGKNLTLRLLTDLLSFHLQLDLQTKLELLAERCVLTRATKLAEILHEQRKETGELYEPDFSWN
ncbi:Lon protease [Thalassoglobus neptunius]|uniref:Lon protease n=1 Tax=Thalassoglobus neptunius TaxID=1938619 RepID=A0A5C5X0A4_9PLAN|nr:LON peptidase substrate-binding domain-containing protein [Thalassoglobus neptunius]TWT55622.1 Lon protease [Thalassoglobus neptunius]